MLKEEQIESHSGVNLELHKCISVIKKKNWKELDFSVGGDAPKNFIAIYEYCKNSGIKKNNIKTWDKYIAKVGHKWYPLESINEYLFNQIGEVLSLNIAGSRLFIIGKQLRFFSKYFLKNNESLEHGAQIFAGYISDKEWVEDVENKGLARRFFTFQFTENAINQMFPSQSKLIMEEFVKMLVFDALTGNNDRHFYNWGVIKHIESKKTPIFAPIFDSARGLFWNYSEQNLLEWFKQPHQIKERVKKYSNLSKPKIGWEGLDDLNHFELINKIYSRNDSYTRICKELINNDTLNSVLTFLNSKFFKFYSKERISLIEKCLFTGTQY